MFPRGVPDIGWGDLAYALTASLWRPAAEASEPAGNTLECLSARSAFDLLLQELALPPGSEVLMSAITIPDMPRIVEHHGLVSVPVDVNPASLAIDARCLATAIGPRSRLLVVAHLFGSRMPMDEIVHIAHRQGLLVVEDLAQAFDGTGDWGHHESDYRLWSFGPIKTATALGGGLLCVDSRERLARIAEIQRRYPVASRGEFARRAVQYAGLKCLARPDCLALIVAWCRHRGIDYDRWIFDLTRALPRGGLIERLRRQPPAPLVRLMRRRLRQSHTARIGRRIERARRLLAALPTELVPGAAAERHAHWVLTILSRDPQGLVSWLAEHGFDATRRASGLTLVAAPASQPHLDPIGARDLLNRLVFLPGYPLPPQAIDRLANLVRQFEGTAGHRAPGRPA